jgi:hypothetical protein
MADETPKPGTLESVEAEVAAGGPGGNKAEAPVVDGVESMAPAPSDGAVPAEGTGTGGPVVDAPEAGNSGPVASSAAERAAPGGGAPIDPAAHGLNGMDPQELEQLRAAEVAFSWQAAEYVQHHKGLKWYGGLALGVIVLLVLAFLIKDWVAIALFLAAAGAAAVYAHKPPRTLLYELTHDGITIDGKQYPYASFRSFGVLADTAWHTIDFESNKRFSPHVSVLFDDDDFEQIVGHLELHLPRIDRKPDLIERISRYVRF